VQEFALIFPGRQRGRLIDPLDKDLGARLAASLVETSTQCLDWSRWRSRIRRQVLKDLRGWGHSPAKLGDVDHRVDLAGLRELELVRRTSDTGQHLKGTKITKS
jgi:glycosyltransferase A (GT-A) superfamily protein (DUF2064 family)